MRTQNGDRPIRLTALAFLCLAMGVGAVLLRIVAIFFPGANLSEMVIIGAGSAMIAYLRPYRWWLWVSLFSAFPMLFIVKMVVGLNLERLREGVGIGYVWSLALIPVSAALGGWAGAAWGERKLRRRAQTGLGNRPLCCFLVLFLGLFAGCDLLDDDGADLPEPDSRVTVRLLLLDPDLAGQSVVNPGSSIQHGRWELGYGILQIGEDSIDLLSGQSCIFSDQANAAPSVQGVCQNGIENDALVGAGEASVLLGVRDARMKRAVPVPTPPGGDFDLDGVANELDNCTILPNEDQSDGNGDGIGDRCSVFDPELGLVRDSDGDGVPDDHDNCVWISNPGQEDTNDPGDGIGDACVAEVSWVRLEGELAFELMLGPIETELHPGSALLVTIDLSSSTSLTCEWAVGSCALNPSTIQLSIGGDL